MSTSTRIRKEIAYCLTWGPQIPEALATALGTTRGNIHNELSALMAEGTITRTQAPGKGCHRVYYWRHNGGH